MVDLHSAEGHGLIGLVAPLLTLIMMVAYVVVARASRRPWPRHRLVLWCAGCLAALAALSGPLETAADADGDAGFAAHMITHLLLGMAAPLLLVLAAPVTLLLRTLPVSPARRLARLLAGWPVRLSTEPLVAATFAVGGLWLLYTTPLYPAMHQVPALHLLVHVHLFVWGYLLTASMISIDPLPHRRSVVHRSLVLAFALAGHAVLAKYLVAHPPAGVSAAAETGAMIMYYGGDVVEVAIMIILWAGWYRRTRPRTARGIAVSTG